MQLQILAHGQLFIQRKRLRHITHAHARGDVACIDRLAEEFGRAFSRIEKAGEHLHGGGLAATIGTEKAKNFPFFNFEADMIHGGEIAETLGQSMRLDHRRGVRFGNKRGERQPARALLFLGRQHGDIRFFQRLRTVLRQHFAGVFVDQQLAGIHRQQVFKLLGFFDVSGGDDNRHIPGFLAQFVDQRPKLAARERVNARRRLIQNQQIGRMHQRTAQAELLFHPARKLSRRTIRKRRQSCCIEQPLDARLAFGCVQTKQPRVKIDVFLHAQRGIQVFTQALWHIRNTQRQALARFFIGHIAAQHVHAARLNSAHTRHQR